MTMSGKYVVARVLPLKLAADGSAPAAAAREALALSQARGILDQVLARMKQSTHACTRDTAIANVWLSASRGGRGLNWMSDGARQGETHGLGGSICSRTGSVG